MACICVWAVSIDTHTHPCPQHTCTHMYTQPHTPTQPPTLTHVHAHAPYEMPSSSPRRNTSAYLQHLIHRLSLCLLLWWHPRHVLFFLLALLPLTLLICLATPKGGDKSANNRETTVIKRYVGVVRDTNGDGIAHFTCRGSSSASAYVARQKAVGSVQGA